MLICILTKNVITSCSVTMMLFLHLEVKPLMTLTTVLYLSCALISAGIKSAIQGSNVPNPDEAVPSFVSGAMAKAGKGLLEGTLQAGTSAVSDKLLDLVGLGGKSAA